MNIKTSEKVASFRKAELFKDTADDGSWSYRLMYNGKLVATDHQRKYLNQIMYQLDYVNTVRY